MNFTSEQRAALAPKGSLNATINLGNPILAARAPNATEPHGVSVDLARLLALALDVELRMLVVDGAGKAVAKVAAQAADVGFFAVDPERAQGIHFTRPYVSIEGAYLVRQDSPIKHNVQVDSAEITVMVGKGSAYDLFLSRHLQRAQIMRAPTSPAVVDEFIAQEASVAAGVKQQLEADALRLNGLRLLPGRFMVIQQAMGTPLGRGNVAADALSIFVDHVLASGIVADALRRQGVVGATVGAVNAAD